VRNDWQTEGARNAQVPEIGDATETHERSPAARPSILRLTSRSKGRVRMERGGDALVSVSIRMRVEVA
jgi:hypothetical protein